MHPILSLVIPYYNAKGTLPQLLDSVMTQSLKEIEIIIVDDRSENPCNDVVEAYRNKGCTIQYIYAEEKLYTMRARLTGVAKATAEIIANADADDILLGQDVLEKHVQLFLHEQPDILGFYAANIKNEQPVELVQYTHSMAPILFGHDILKKYITDTCKHNSLWPKMICKKLYLAISPIAWKSYVFRRMEDKYVSILLFANAQKYIGSTLVGYGHKPDTVKFSNNAPRHALETFFILQEIPQYLIQCGFTDDIVKKFSEYTRETLKYYIDSMLNLYTRDSFDLVNDMSLDKLIRTMGCDEKTLIKMLLILDGDIL